MDAGSPTSYVTGHKGTQGAAPLNKVERCKLADIVINPLNPMLPQQATWCLCGLWGLQSGCARKKSLAEQELQPQK